jgi:hypothetical protein
LVLSAQTMGRTALSQIDDFDSISTHFLIKSGKVLRRWPWKLACSFLDTMTSNALYFRMNLFAVLLLALSLLAAAKTVSKPGDWVALPKIGVPNSWAVDSERIIEGDPLLKISPDVRNKHRETVPVFRKVDGECDCAEHTMCRKDRLSPESVRISSVY